MLYHHRLHVSMSRRVTGLTIKWSILIKLETMRITRLGMMWCGWIMALLQLARASVLVNGSPTYEFRI